jgi:hypothetical protein
VDSVKRSTINQKRGRNRGRRERGRAAEAGVTSTQEVLQGYTASLKRQWSGRCGFEIGGGQEEEQERGQL